MERRHVSTSIEGLLRQSNGMLRKLLKMDPLEARRELKKRQAKGEKLIPSANCEGFCPVNGCPGHIIPDGKD